jgi:outer membrane protein
MPVKPVIAIAVMLCSLWTAQTQAQDLKIGVVDNRQIWLGLPQKTAIEDKLRKEFGARQDGLVKMNNDLNGLVEKARRDGPVMSNPDKIELKRKVDQLRDDLSRKDRELKEDFDIRSKQEFVVLQKQVSVAIDAVAKEQQFDIVLSSETVPYISNRADITEQVLKKLGGKLTPNKK